MSKMSATGVSASACGEGGGGGGGDGEVVEVAAQGTTAALPSRGRCSEFERSEVRRAASSERRSSCGTWRRWLPPGRAGVPQIWPGPRRRTTTVCPPTRDPAAVGTAPHAAAVGDGAAAPRENPVCGVAGAAPAPSGDPPAAAPP